MHRLNYLEFSDTPGLSLNARPCAAAVVAAARCQGGLSSSSNQANPTTTTQSAAGQQVTGSYSVAGGQGSLNVGAGGNYLESGASQTQTTLSNSQVQVGAKDATQLSNVTAKRNSTINITDNGAVAAATKLAGRVVTSQANAFQQALQANQSGLTAALNANESNLGNVLAAANQLETTSASGASAQLLKTLLYLGIGVLAIVGVWLIFGKK